MLYPTKSAFFCKLSQDAEPVAEGLGNSRRTKGWTGSALIGYCILERRCQEVQRVHLRTWRTSQTLRAERTTRHPRRVDGHVVPCEKQPLPTTNPTHGEEKRLTEKRNCGDDWYVI